MQGQGSWVFFLPVLALVIYLQLPNVAVSNGLVTETILRDLKLVEADPCAIEIHIVFLASLGVPWPSALSHSEKQICYHELPANCLSYLKVVIKFEDWIRECESVFALQTPLGNKRIEMGNEVFTEFAVCSLLLVICLAESLYVSETSLVSLYVFGRVTSWGWRVAASLTWGTCSSAGLYLCLGLSHPFAFCHI